MAAVSRPLRILVVAACPFPARRGTPLRIERLSEALAARGHRVAVAAYPIGETAGDRLPFPVHRPGGRFEARGLSPGFHREKLAHDRALRRLVAELVSGDPWDVVHAHHVEGVWCAVPARRRGIPVVYDAHTMLESELPTYRPRLAAPLRRLGRVGDRWTLARADGVVAVTADIRNRIVTEHGFPAARAVVAMNGIDMAQFRPVAGPPHRIVYTGTLAGYQDVDRLLEAFALARREVPELRLVLAVSDSFAPLEPLAARLGIREALEVVPDDFARLPDLLAGCGIAVLPRRVCDGLPQKLLNYMAAGKAVVAAAGSAKVIEDGRTGVVVRDGGVTEFARALVDLARDPERVAWLGGSARAWVEAHASWEAAAVVVEGLYRRLMPRS